jgi:hypothetical protein
MSTKRETFKLKLLDGELVELPIIDRVGEFVLHPPWQDPKSRKWAVVTHAPTGRQITHTWSKIAKAFMRGARTNRTFARLVPAAHAYAANPEKFRLDPKSTAARAWRAIRRYERILDKRIEL